MSSLPGVCIGPRESLIGIVSHDLRNPLAAITMSAASLLRRPDLEERQRKPLGRIFTSAERAIRMIRDLLDFTHARLGGGLPIKPEPLDLHALTRQVVEELQSSHPERTLQLETEGDAHGAWDADRMAQVLDNLVSNSLHYSPPETPVWVRSRGGADAVLLEIHNVGAPIPEEVLPRVFQPMQRGLGAEKASGSLGLGLYIVEAHGGSVSVDAPRRAPPSRCGCPVTPRRRRGEAPEPAAGESTLGNVVADAMLAATRGETRSRAVIGERLATKQGRRPLNAQRPPARCAAR